jgi:hypothetical protein
MDPRERADIEAAIEQGNSFISLSTHPEWPRFWAWLSKAREDYDRASHSSKLRPDHLGLVRVLEAYDTIDALMRNFDRATKQVPALRQRLENDGSDPSTPA